MDGNIKLTPAVQQQSQTGGLFSKIGGVLSAGLSLVNPVAGLASSFLGGEMFGGGTDASSATSGSRGTFISGPFTGGSNKGKWLFWIAVGGLMVWYLCRKGKQ